MVPYMIFITFCKIQIVAQNPCVTLRFIENCQFGPKSNQNTVFLGRDPHIPDQLYIMVKNMSFYRFRKNSNFHSKSRDVGQRFYQKSQVWGKNRPKLCISWSYPPYCGSLIQNNLVYEFLWVLKKN
jgi:hypothetical protein